MRPVNRCRSHLWLYHKTKTPKGKYIGMTFLRMLKSGRHRLPILVACVICLHFLYMYWRSEDVSVLHDLNDGHSGKQTNRKPRDAKAVHSYLAFFEDIEKYKPKSDSIKDKYKNDKAPEIFAGVDNVLLNKELLENVLDIPDATFNELKTLHKKYIDEHMSKLLNRYRVSTFGNVLEEDIEWKDYHGSSGYLLVGGGQYSWLSYLVIRQIRDVGSTLPIELFIPSEEEYEADFCEKVLPQFNARCITLDKKVLSYMNARIKAGAFQFKMLALLRCSFENVIYVDSDNFPSRNPEYLLESVLYKESQLIIWPDAWARTTNPKFYEIAGVDVKENKIRYCDYDRKQSKEQGLTDAKPFSQYTFKDTWYHTFEGTLPDPTSEAGMFIVNKTNQLKTLLLCFYYNLFGPDYYYPLMTQGSAGEGDKETFIAAAHVMNQPWHQTIKGFKWTGYISESDGQFKSKALSHYDPIQSLAKQDEPDVLFMHLSYPKYYPNWLYDLSELIYPDLGHHIRMYEAIYENVGYDVDLRIFQYFVQGSCESYFDPLGRAKDGSTFFLTEYMGPYLSYIAGQKDIQKKRCDEVFMPHLTWLKETTKYPNTVITNS